MQKKLLQLFLLLALGFFGQQAAAQVTASSISGIARDANGEGMPEALVTAVHEPSGTRYAINTREDGRFTLPNVRIGGPYTITIAMTGAQDFVEKDIYLSLGEEHTVNATLQNEVQLEGVEVVADAPGALIGSDRTGAATNINQEVIQAMPTLSRSLNDYLRLTPQSRSSSVAATAGSGVSFAGQDSRFNNLMIDGSIFNNSFGLASAPGGQTNSTPISLDAIQEIQINLAPYDVRQGGFTGAGINAVTRSGTNLFQGSVFFNTRNEGFVGTKAGETEVSTADFNVSQFGFRFGGPIIKNKLFFFVNGEFERRTDPSGFIAFRDSATTTGSNVSRVEADVLDALRDTLINRFGYDPGEYENYNLQTYSDKILAKLDYNINERSRLSLRYNYLKSFRDVFASNSGVFGNGDSRRGLTSLNFSNSNYIINNNIHSIIVEYNNSLDDYSSLNVSAGFTANRDFRGSGGGIFPLVDILDGNGRNYTTFGYEPFTPNNILNTDTWQAQVNYTRYIGAHTLTAGANFEYFRFENTFTPTYYGQYIFKSLQDFYDAIQGDSVQLQRYQLTYSALEGGAVPTAVTEAMQPGLYLQDAFRVSDRFKLTAGLRVDLQSFKQTALNNPIVENLMFLDENFDSVQYKTGELPGAQILFSPRVGFNYDVMGDKSLQVRGGSGLFTGRPPFVWLSNQVGNTGLYTGSIRTDNTFAFPFSPDVTQHIPDNATLPSSFNIAVTDRNFKFPQVWRSDIAVDYKLPFDLVATFEGLYSKNVNNIRYINANLTAPSDSFAGPDARPIYAGLGLTGNAANNALRVNDNITDAIVLKNTNKGYSYSMTFKLERPFKNGLYLMAAYNYSQAKDVMTGGSIAFSSWRDLSSVNGNNLPDLAFSDFDQRHRIIGAVSYRKEYAKYFASQISLFGQWSNQGRYSFTYNGDMNGDGLNGNDLIYVPEDASELNFQQYDYIAGGDTTTITVAAQVDALNALINGNEYLSDAKGGYLGRNGAILPWLGTIDVTFMQEFKLPMKNGQTNTLQFRLDLYNFGNLLSKKWGVGDQVVNNRALRYRTRDADGEPVYRLDVDPTTGQLPTETYRPSATLSDVWQIQLGVRYIFN